MTGNSNGEEVVVDGLVGDLAEDTSTPIVKKYDEQMRMLLTQKLDIPIRSLLPMLDSNPIQLNVEPDFQRRDRWDEKKQSRFIESIIMNVPIPPVFLGEDEYGTYVVLDGRQRLTAISSYLRNLYELQGLEVWDELNTKRFSQLGEVQNFILRRFIPAIVILKESSPEIKYDVFDRLNTGGVVALPMEIRNAVHRGLFSVLIKKLSENPIFRELWGIPSSSPGLEENKIYATMADVELVLRFFAIQEYKTFSGRFKDYLNDFIKDRNDKYKSDKTLETQDRKLFKQTVENVKKIFGTDAFRKPSTDRESSRSAPYADAIMFGCSKVDITKFTNVKIAKAKKEIEELFKVTDFVSAVSKGTNGKGAITTRVESVEKILLGIQNS